MRMVNEPGNWATLFAGAKEGEKVRRKVVSALRCLTVKAMLVVVDEPGQPSSRVEFEAGTRGRAVLPALDMMNGGVL